MRRLFTRLLFSTSNVRTLITFFLILFFSLLMCCLLGETGAFTLSSRSWRWPTPNEGPRISQDDDVIHDTKYYQDGDSHQYILRSHQKQSTKELSRTGKSPVMKIMFISDPHIMCTHNTKEWWLARWDADTYLKRSFSHLHSHLKPNLLIFVGDLFSSGFQATDQQWEDYLQCFRDIYPTSSAEKVIVAMGDNDLGGEGRDLMTQTVYRRYVQTFGELNSIFDIAEGIRVIKITTTCFLRPPSTEAETECRENLVHFLDSYSIDFEPFFTILISHVPMNKLSKSTQFTFDNKVVDIQTKILHTLTPDMVVSGHVHHEAYTRYHLDKGDVHEITVPTCSYRMGKRNMGIGTAVISSSGSVAYKVNWLPPRYPFLFSYCVIGLTLLFVCVYLFLRFR